MSDPKPIDVFDQASLEAFMADLVLLGMEPIPGTLRRLWSGPIHPAFEPLTETTSMRLAIVDGWPYQPPALLVDGLHTNHATPGGLVCMWREGDISLRWVTGGGLVKRIEEWCDGAQHGFPEADLPRDAFLNFTPNVGELATFDLERLNLGGPGNWGEFLGVVHPHHRIELVPRGSVSGPYLLGAWFRAGELEVPPRKLVELRSALTRAQWRGLERMFSQRRDVDELRSSGGVDLILLSWDRAGRQDLLVLACGGARESLRATALQPAPNDERTLLLRAGPDAAAVADKRAILFGVGALGGFVAVALAESGIRSIELVDPERLLPGNVVRHVAGHDKVGMTKVEAVEELISRHAPWTSVVRHLESPKDPKRLSELVAGADVIVDATGNAAITYPLALTAQQHGKLFITGALYRGGSIGRVRRQGVPEDTLIADREESDRYPIIPAGDDSDLLTPELGCSAPVNNAPPASVLSCGALIAHVAMDALTERFHMPDEVIDVYRPLAEPPFDRIGRVALG